MRTPDDLPGRRREKRERSGSTRRGRILLGLVAAALVVFLLSLRGIAGFYTDFLWFDSLGQASVWRGLVGARLALAVIFILLFFAMAWVNFFVADRLAPPFRPAGPEDEMLERYHELVEGRMHWIRIAVAAFLAVIAGVGAAGEWNSWILFTNSVDFGITDPQFGYDVGFYVFRLPFLSFVVDWFFASLLIILIITAVAHYLNGGIRVQTSAPRVSPQVKAHLSLLLAGLALIRAVDYWLQRFELTTSSRGVVDGATYTDVNAQLPALNLLVLISLAAAALFIVNIFRRGWTLPVVAVALWGFVAIVVAGVYPAYVQRFQVEPNESARESDFIERNMDATRFALGIDEDTVRRERYVPNTSDISTVNLEDYESTIRNIRLWDPSDAVSLQTFRQLQSIRDYYEISEIDVGRYEIDGEMTTVGLGLRTIDSSRVPISGWEGRHLAYTHGYGAVVAPLGATDRREPDFIVRDIPGEVQVDGLNMPQPRVYFGEDQSGYVMVGTGRAEIDYEDEDEGIITTPYEGEDGVSAGSLLRRMAFALRFGDINPIISGFVGSDSRMIYFRDIQDRINELAPFLHADADPYPVLLEDRIVWVQDLYTTTDRFPYGQRANTDELASDSGLRHRFNYVRNSVKATVDAYDGTVTFYVVEPDDPIVQAYRKAFPSLFVDAPWMLDPDEAAELDPEERMLAEQELAAEYELAAHLRYPEDLFRVQTVAWQRYHLQEVDAFYNQTNAWTVARDPGTAGAGEATQVTDASGEIIDIRDARMPPYYQLLQLPGEEDIQFTLTRPFVPFSPDDDRQQLTGYMAAHMDPGRYGELVVYEMPSGNLPEGPGIVATNIDSDPFVSQQQTLLGQSGSTVLVGNLLMLPIDDALVFVQPFYVEPDDPRRPRLERVIVAFGERVAIAGSLQDALEQVFDADIETAEDPDIIGEDIDIEPVDGLDPEEAEEAEEPDETEEPDEPAEREAPTGTVDEQTLQLLDELATLSTEAQDALDDGDLGTYQEKVSDMQSRIDDLYDLLSQEDEEGESA